MNPTAIEMNFDGIVGPTHNYSGLSYGNVASINNQRVKSNPKEAALQGLEKMKFLADRGFKQGVLPPHERPHIQTLKSLGFTGSDVDILKSVQKNAPSLLMACSSSAAMWVANAATISPSIDNIDQHVHFTPANLSAMFHRSIEPEFTSKILQIIFGNPLYFRHHPALPQGSYFSDEGAANHSRFCKTYGNPGVHLFVYDRYSFKTTPALPKIFPARQTIEASEAIARLHQIYPERIVFAQQNPKAIDAGVFHNDVASVGNCHVFLYHEAAFLGTDEVISALNQKMISCCDTEMVVVKVPEKRVSLDEAVSSYLFNSQLLSNPDGTMVLIAPSECRESPAVQQVLNEIVSNPENPIRDIHYFNLRESMRNGGGPACLRLRVTLTERELEAVHKDVLLTDRLYNKLKDWISKHYRSHLLPEDLADPHLLTESREALHELTKILNLGSIYSFQK